MAKRKHLLLGQNRIKNMKKTNTYSYKLAVAATSLVMVYFASGIASIAQATELLKAEPVKYNFLLQEAKDNLALSFTTLTVNLDTNKDITQNIMAKQQNATKENQAVNLTKTALIAE